MDELKKLLEEMVAQGKLSKDDADKILQQAVAEYEEESGQEADVKTPEVQSEGKFTIGNQEGMRHEFQAGRGRVISMALGKQKIRKGAMLPDVQNVKQEDMMSGRVLPDIKNDSTHGMIARKEDSEDLKHGVRGDIMRTGGDNEAEEKEIHKPDELTQEEYDRETADEDWKSLVGKALLFVSVMKAKWDKVKLQREQWDEDMRDRRFHETFPFPPSGMKPWNPEEMKGWKKKEADDFGSRNNDEDDSREGGVKGEAPFEAGVALFSGERESPKLEKKDDNAELVKCPFGCGWQHPAGLKDSENELALHLLRHHEEKVTKNNVTKYNPHLPGHSFTACVAYMKKQGYSEESAKRICGKLQAESGER